MAKSSLDELHEKIKTAQADLSRLREKVITATNDETKALIELKELNSLLLAQRGKMLVELLRANDGMIDVLTPTHTRNCSDEKYNDPYSRDVCARCVLLEAKKSNYWDSDFSFVLEVVSDFR